MFGFSPIIIILGFLVFFVSGILIFNKKNNRNKKKNKKEFINSTPYNSKIKREEGMSQYDDIAKLADLKEKGLITEDEFTQQKKKILSMDFLEESVIENKQPNSFTFKAVVFFVLGLIVPLWPISLPLFWYLAYKSYKSGE